MSDDIEIFSTPQLKEMVQDMRDLLSQGRLAFLLGAGCSFNAGLPLMSKLTEEVLVHPEVDEKTTEILVAVKAQFTGAQYATIEDYMSEIVDLLSIAERRSQRGAKKSKIQVAKNIEKDSTGLQAALDQIKKAIASAIGDKEVDVTGHQKFIRAIHGALQAGKAGRGVDYFVLNYDTLIEDALGLERVAYSDGFCGAATGWWKPDLFNSGGDASRVFKIHGSIDWCQIESDPQPRRIRAGVKTDSNEDRVLIYPAATKYIETQRDPFAHLLHQMRKSLCPREGNEMVLVICGYSFGDPHIDLEVEQALIQSEGRLTIAAFCETDEPEGVLGKWLGNPQITDQIRVYANKGFFHGDKVVRFDSEIPWWKFELLGRLLGGER